LGCSDRENPNTHARNDYQQALQILIEFGASEALPSEARYSQARTYNTLRYNSESLPSLGRYPSLGQ
jgi:hypothetical protein